MRSSENFYPLAQFFIRMVEFSVILYFRTMTKEISQSKVILEEIKRLKEFFETTPILIKEYKTSFFTVPDIPFFINSELKSAASFNSKNDFNPPLQRLQDLEVVILNQITVS